MASAHPIEIEVSSNQVTYVMCHFFMNPTAIKGPEEAERERRKHLVLEKRRKRYIHKKEVIKKKLFSLSYVMIVQQLSVTWFGEVRSQCTQNSSR